MRTGFTIPEKLNPKKLYQEMQEVRAKGIDYTLSDHLASFGEDMTLAKFYHEMGLEIGQDTVRLILDRQDESYRWLVPELIRDAIRKGFINAPIYPQLIAGEESIAQPTQVMPYWDMTGLDNKPKDLGLGESMELGTIKYGQKTVRISKSGIGIELADECIQYTPISLLSIFLADMGAKLGSSLTAKAITCLINGEQADASEAASTIGITTANTLAYADFIRMGVRGSLINRSWTKFLANETLMNTILNLAEFKPSANNAAPVLGLNLKTPVPKNYDAFVHSSVPDGKIIFLDSGAAMVKLTAQPLRVEADRIVQRQINGTYCSLTTGFAILFRDGRVIVDTAQAFSSAGWPTTYMTPLF